MKRIHHFRDPRKKGNLTFCGIPVQTFGHEPVMPPANICPECDRRWAEYRKDRNASGGRR